MIRKKKVLGEVKEISLRAETYEKLADLLATRYTRTNKDAEHYKVALGEVSKELRLYTWAFSIACGRLMAQTKSQLDPEAFMEQLLNEAKAEISESEK